MKSVSHNSLSMLVNR